MIASVRGEVIAIEEDALVVDVNHLGMRVYAPLNRMNGQYCLNDEIFLHTHLIVREDQWTLFGFPSQDELIIFKHILNVSGIGGKGAMAILSFLSPEEIVGAVGQGNAKPFEKVSGIGKKTAQRIVLELKDKVTKLGIVGAESAIAEAVPTKPELDNGDAVAALCQLGYSATEAKKAVVAVVSEDPLIDSDTLLRKALMRLSKF
ncbi:MAG: Holliday junction branch migration protein RuvA [Firmicutes bacterium]|nr:Holliday junction branch migration protein RuvA [Bacillota bacterium]